MRSALEHPRALPGEMLGPGCLNQYLMSSLALSSVVGPFGRVRKPVLLGFVEGNMNPGKGGGRGGR
jgi:hypothetical protein